MPGKQQSRGKKKPTGRPPIPIDEDEVYKLAQFGCTYREIGSFFGVSEATIHERFQTTVEKGRDHLKKVIRKKQVELALKGDRTMLIWLGKQLLDQREPSPLIAIQNNNYGDTEKEKQQTSVAEIVEAWEEEARKEFGLPEPAKIPDAIPTSMGSG